MAKKTTPKFTPDELKTLSSIFHRVWDYIGMDVLQMTQEMDGRNYVKRDEVIEMCLDADRPQEQARGDDEKALLKRFSDLPWEEQNKLARKMFTYARYGM